MAEYIVEESGEFLRNGFKFACLVFQSEFEQRGKVADKIRIAGRRFALDIVDGGLYVIPKRDRPHPHEVFLIIQRVLPEQFLRLLNCLAKEMLASAPFIERIVNIDFIAGRKCHTCRLNIVYLRRNRVFHKSAPTS